MFKTSQEIFITIILGALLFTTLSVITVFVIWSYKKRQQKHFVEIETIQSEFENQLLRSQIEVQEKTLSTLSKDLHDNVGQLLSTTRMILGMMERSMPLVPDELHTAQETLVKAIQEIRSLSKALSKEWLEQFSFIENVTTEVNRIQSGGLIQINFIYETPDLPITSEQQIILFRIVQESVQNIIKHSGAKNLLLEVNVESNIAVSLKDDGIGFDPNKTYNGVGLLNMRRRVELLGGTISWQSELQKGTTITISIPINEK
jgi:signal transduction histidine kinase